MKRFALALALVVGMIVPARADSLPSISGPVAANGTLTLPGLGAYSTCSIDVGGTWSGTLGVTGPNNAAILVRSYASDSTTSTSITGNGLSFVACAGLSSLTVTGGGSNTGTAEVTIAASQGIAKLGLNGVAGVAASAPITSSGGTNPTIGCASCVVLNPTSAQTGPINVTGTITAAQLVPNAAGYILENAGTPGSGRVLLGNSGGAFLDWNGANYTLGGSGPLSFGNAITQAGYAQHGILSITTPASCSANTLCASGTLDFNTAMTAATYSCPATAENYPYSVYITAKTTTSVTFNLFTPVAISAAQTVPVDYACAL